jgi:hypothetical protein
VAIQRVALPWVLLAAIQKALHVKKLALLPGQQKKNNLI